MLGCLVGGMVQRLPKGAAEVTCPPCPIHGDACIANHRAGLGAPLHYHHQGEDYHRWRGNGPRRPRMDVYPAPCSECYACAGGHCWTATGKPIFEVSKMHRVRLLANKRERMRRPISIEVEVEA